MRVRILTRALVFVAILLAASLPLRALAVAALLTDGKPVSAAIADCHHAEPEADQADANPCNACGVCCTGAMTSTGQAPLFAPRAAHSPGGATHAAPAPDPRRLERPPAHLAG